MASRNALVWVFSTARVCGTTVSDRLDLLEVIWLGVRAVECDMGESDQWQGRAACSVIFLFSYTYTPMKNQSEREGQVSDAMKYQTRCINHRSDCYDHNHRWSVVDCEEPDGVFLGHGCINFSG